MAQKRNGRYDLSLDELNECLPGDDLEQLIDAGECSFRSIKPTPKQSEGLFAEGGIYL